MTTESTTTTETATETAPGAPETAAAPDTSAQPETSPTGDVGTESDDLGDGDTFPREVVEKLRKENATMRERAGAAETQLDALRRQAVEGNLRGLKPTAFWMVNELGDLLDEDGSISSKKLTAAIGNTRDQLGIERRPAPSADGLFSGTTGRSVDGRVHSKWNESFRPRER